MAKRTQTRFLARTVDGLEAVGDAGIHPAQLATLRSKTPAGDHWLHEIRYDGYRLQFHLNKGRARVYTRTGLDWIGPSRFPSIAAAFDPRRDCDLRRRSRRGEGRPHQLSELQAALAAGRRLALAHLLQRSRLSSADMMTENGSPPARRIGRTPTSMYSVMLLPFVGSSVSSEQKMGCVRATRETQRARDVGKPPRPDHFADDSRDA
ncbi:hypothetical protein ACVW0I_006029 [Bradyrhizobium sp. LM6.11]